MFGAARGKNYLIFFLVFAITVLSITESNKYSLAKSGDESLTISEFLARDFKEYADAMKEIPVLLREVIKSKDQIKIGSLNKIADALEIYKMDKGSYPENIKTLIGDYLNKTKIFDEPSFYYEPDGLGWRYEMGIKLDTGEFYTIKN